MNTDKFKEKLEEEKAKLEEELKTVGRKNPDNPEDWEATPGDVNQRSADMNKLASNIEEFETHTAILKQLEKQLLDVNDALKKIEEGKYGICEANGEQIEEGRLEANPAARTCHDHMEDHKK
ncbi:TraR/DksA C4-type zinc finger protein [Candidatus Pacebacteria bacterium]|nr:TraR/DksA C4-type zinc finger protein [Candidatus Paceibacterota bacterium]